ncbi:Hsp70 family protein [Micromonospora sp. WMMD1102]|uniref:Hsp70 family protein n=1 Tax=Micromonospora sp. WMMD1102 TaxID=3016105 RepID=UPI002414D997|nr:Hsp70 family protein [Micromonospora sp. WMMD1102]MDG4791658.1 Hsp70 family protein [Micromonospora sp. WMMD1102]
MTSRSGNGPGATRLGVDFGTSSTVAMVASSDGRSRPLLFDGSPILPSAVCGRPDGELLVGRDAVNAAPTFPDRFDPHPKRRIDEGVLLLGDREVPVVDAIAAVLRRVVDEARRVLGGLPERVVLTHPVSWGARRREVLAGAAAAAGIGGARLVAEPVAAGQYLVDVLGQRIPIGSNLLVYDLGAGTFDVSVLRRLADGFEVVASQGLPDAGGLEIDAGVMSHLAASLVGRNPRTWERLSAPVTPADRRHRQQAWDAIRAAKETLSRTGHTLMHLSAIDDDVPLGREQLDALARPVLDRTISTARAVRLDAGIPADEQVAVLLVGGASRMPLVATLITRSFGTAPTVIEQPELVVAEGALTALHDTPAPATGPARFISHAIAGPTHVIAGPTQVLPVLQVGQEQSPGTSGVPAGDRRAGPSISTLRDVIRRRRPMWIALAAVVVAVALATGIGLTLNGKGGLPAGLSLGVGIGDGIGDPDGRGTVAQEGDSRTSPGPSALSQDGHTAAPGGTGGPSVTRNPSTPPTQPSKGPANDNPTDDDPASDNPVVGPDPLQHRTWRYPNPPYACAEAGMRVTRTSGTSTAWPPLVATACAARNSNGSTGEVACKASAAICDGITLRATFRLVIRPCGGGSALETVPLGPREETERFLQVLAYGYPSTLIEAVVTVSLMEAKAEGSVWKAATPATVTSPCFDPVNP